MHRVQQVRRLRRQHVPGAESLVRRGGRGSGTAGHEVGVGDQRCRTGRPARGVPPAPGRGGHCLLGHRLHAPQIALHGGHRREDVEALHLEVGEVVQAGQVQRLLQFGPGQLDIDAARIAELGSSAARVQQCLERGHGRLAVAGRGKAPVARPCVMARSSALARSISQVGARRLGPRPSCVLQLDGGRRERPRVQMGDRRGEREPGVRRARVGSHGRQGTAQRPEVPAQEQGHTRLANQRSDQGRVAGALGMTQGVHRLRLGQPPSGGGFLEAAVGLRPLPGEVGDQVGAEQRMDAVEAGGGALDERRLAAEDVEPLVGVGPCRQFDGDHSPQGGAHADHPQEVLRVRAHAVEDLDRQVLGDRALVTREIREERGLVIGAAQREGGEPEPGGPAIRAGLQYGHLRRRQLEAGGSSMRRGVVKREAQGVGPDLEQPALEPQSWHGDRRVRPAGQDEPQARGAAADQPGEVPQYLPRGQFVHVVQNDPDRRLGAVQRVGECLTRSSPSARCASPRPPQADAAGRRRSASSAVTARPTKSPGVVVVGIQEIQAVSGPPAWRTQSAKSSASRNRPER